MSDFKKTGFSAEKFVENILSEGKNVPCDETLQSFGRNGLPAYYDEGLYKRGQKFFQDNIFGFTFGAVLGFILLIAVPDILNILIMTNMSGSTITSYKRYLETLFHIHLWYSKDFQHESIIQMSIEYVRKKHNAASKQSLKKLKYKFNQKDMTLTLFTFIGFPLLRRKMIGIHDPNEDDLKGFMHTTRVLGYAMGIEDRFNICRDSTEETRQICDIILEKVFKPLLHKPNGRFKEMVYYMIDGFSAVEPIMDYSLCMTYLEMLLENEVDYRKLTNVKYRNPSWIVKIKLTVISTVMYYSQFNIVKLITKHTTLFKFWLAKTFPILAYIKFGTKNVHVDIQKKLQESNKVQ